MKTPHTQAVQQDRAEAAKFLFQHWLLQHLQAFVFSLGQICRTPVASFLTAAVIGISLALPAGFFVALENTRQIISGWEGSVEITAFLKMEVDDAAANRLREQISRQDNIASVELVTRQQALDEYRELSGFAAALNVLDQNPLPSLLLVKPQLGADPELAAEQLLAMLQTLPEIDTAQYDRQWVKRLNVIIEIVQRMVLALAAFLGLAVLLIIGNTIRMLIYHRRAEIEVSKLFGATDGFIQRPFLYSGFWYGIIGGLFAWILVELSLFLLQGPAADLARLYASDFRLVGLAPMNILYLLGSGVLLGLIGSWVSVQRHLRSIEPA